MTTTMEEMRKHQQQQQETHAVLDDEGTIITTASGIIECIPAASAEADADAASSSQDHPAPGLATTITPLQMRRSKSELILLSPQFGTNLMTDNEKERDPLFYYEVQRVIGTGSMGSVSLVKKRKQTVGGSARKVVRDTIQKQKRHQQCFQLPFGIGGLFRACLDAELRVPHNDEDADEKKEQEAQKDNVIITTSTEWMDSSKGSSLGSTSTASVYEGEEERRRSSTRSSRSRNGGDYLYAMKSIHLNRILDTTFVKELKNEITILKTLDHPQIVRPIETFDCKQQIFIVMEVCTGGDLYSRDPYTEEEAARIISSVLSAVAYLHSNNVAHRDLKYENILFVNESPTSPIKLIDFGLSKVYYGGGNRSSSEESPSSTTASTKSKAKSSGTGSGGGYLTEGVGTIYTMAPEVLKGSYTNDADVWSVGVIAYMLLSSQMPFYGRKRQVIVEQILAGKYDFRGRRWRRISEPAKAFVRDLLVVDPAERLDADRASSAVWLNKRFAATTRGPKEQEIRETQKSLLNYAGYTKLKKMAMMVVAHRSTCEEIGILRKVFQKYANDTNNNINDQDPASSSSSKGCITYKEFCIAWKESGLPPEDTRAIFNAVDLDGSGRIRYTEFLAATIEAQGVISEERLAEAFDRFDTDDTGYISVDNLAKVLGKDFPRNEIEDILFDACDDSSNASVSSVITSRTKDRISYAAFLQLWERNTKKSLHENKLRMLGSQANLSALAASPDDDDDDDSDAMPSSTLECQEAAMGRASFLMDKHGTTKKNGNNASNTMVKSIGIADTMNATNLVPPQKLEYVDEDTITSSVSGIVI